MADAGAVRFPSVAYDATNDAYLVAQGLGSVTVRWVSASGAPLGSQVTVNTFAPSGARVACGNAPDPCLVAWVEEPYRVMGRRVRYGQGGTVEVLELNPITIVNSVQKYPEGAPAIAYSPVADQFLVAWTDADVRIRAAFVPAVGTPNGQPFDVSTSFILSLFPSAAYNSAADEFVVAFQAEHSDGAHAAAQRIAPITGQLLGGPVRLITDSNESYPEIAYNSVDNQFLTIAWHQAGVGNWYLHGRRSDGALNPIGNRLVLAYNAGGIFFGLAHNPVSNIYLSVHQHPHTDAVMGLPISATGTPGTVFQVLAHTATQPEARVVGSTKAARFMTVGSMRFRAVMSQVVQVTSVTGGGGGGGGGGSAPGVPSAVTPAGYIGTNLPTYTWNAVAGAAQYQLWVDDSQGNKIQTWYTAAQAGCAAGTGTCSLSPAVSLANGTATWWVRAWNTSGYSGWSSPRTFTVGSSAPSLLGPSGYVSSSPVTFSWTPVPGATHYYLWINDVQGPRWQRWLTAAQVGCASGGTCRMPVTFHPAPLAPGVGLYWVQAWSSTAGYGPWSGVGTFLMAPLHAPTLLTPNGGFVPSTRIEFGWLPVFGADEYFLWVNDATGNKVQKWFKTAEAGCPTAEGFCLVYLDLQLTPGPVTWWIQPWSGVVGYGPWSAGVTFYK